jgi:hypothetical protein
MDEIKLLSMDTQSKEKVHSEVFMREVIKGVVPFFHTIAAGGSLSLTAGPYYHILVQFEGSAIIKIGGASYDLDGRVTFTPGIEEDLELKAKTDVKIFEIQYLKRDGDEELIKDWKVKFPYILPYEKSLQYKDAAKSDKTISRIMLEQRHIPRFAMGSVEMIGPDHMLGHGHPKLDQFFVSFPENDIFVILDGEPYRMRGDEILHIPLGGDHGVQAIENKHCHYIWIDFMMDDTGYTQLDKGHVKTGQWRSLD